MNYIIANWKCNKSSTQACEWIARFAESYQASDEQEIVLAPPMIGLQPVADYLKDHQITGIKLAAQDVSPFPPGNYTGATPAAMLKGLVDYCIVGHIERRRYFHETSLDVTNKVSELADVNITPIVCVETSNAMSQLTALNDIECEQMVVAYCPVDALSYHSPEPIERVTEAVKFISTIVVKRPIIYGGAVSEKNARIYSEISGLSGLFVGSASHQPNQFQAIVEAGK
ncbi:MAG: triosephosphate isomerase [Desulfobulbaceae bacterium]|nr:MAG: triosephosphate isomerase [Desulfobulbaceae bacterium]